MNDQTPIQTLVEIPPQDALAVFSAVRKDGQPHPIDAVLARVRAEIDGFLLETLDIGSATDRKRIASFAYRIAQSKTAIEKVGKTVAAEVKEVPKRVDATRRHVETTLDKWRDEVRQPLTEWEIAEDQRVAKHSSALAALRDLGAPPAGTSSAALKARLADADAVEAGADGEDFAGEYAIAKNAAAAALTEAITRAEKHEAEQAELAVLRAEVAKRQAEEAAEKHRREGEERARLDAEADAAAERARVKRDQELAAAEAARKDAEAAAAIAAAEKRAAEAEAAAQKRIEDQKRADEAAEAERQRNVAHRRKVNAAAVAALLGNGLDEETAKLVVKLIAQGAVPAVSIRY